MNLPVVQGNYHWNFPSIRNKDSLSDFIERYGFSVIEMKLVYGGVVPVGVTIAKKERNIIR